MDCKAPTTVISDAFPQKFVNLFYGFWGIVPRISTSLPELTDHLKAMLPVVIRLFLVFVRAVVRVCPTKAFHLYKPTVKEENIIPALKRKKGAQCEDQGYKKPGEHPAILIFFSLSANSPVEKREGFLAIIVFAYIQRVIDH